MRQEPVYARRRLAQQVAQPGSRQLTGRRGGDPRITENEALLPQAPDATNVTAPRGGFVTAVRAESLGRASNELGAGRARVGDPIDHAVGVVLGVKRGEQVTAGQPVVELHHRGGRGLDAAQQLCRDAIVIADEPPPHRDKVLGEIR